MIRQTPTGFVFHLKASNGETIANSEVYASLTSCRNGIKSVMTNAPIANLENQTDDSSPRCACPKFEVYTAKNGEFRFRLKARNGQNIAASEGYTTEKACLNGIDSVRRNAADAQIVMEE
jgi:uncharacterized protein YegP (UPF0339 family)